MLDPCVFRVIVGGDVVAMMVVHADFNLVATKEVTEVIVSTSSQRFLTKHVGEVEWLMVSDYKRDRKGLLEISRTQVFRSVLNRVDVLKSSLSPVTPFLNHRHGGCAVS